MSGLMSDPEKRNQLFAIISKRQVLISTLLFAGGIVGFAALCYVDFAQKTYFSENALLPGVVDEMFSSNDRKFASELINEVSMLYGNISHDAEPILAPWIAEKLDSFGLESYQQQFSMSYPTPGSATPSIFHGTNVYGILRAPRSAGHEGMALVAPIRTTGPYVRSNAAGIGVLLALAKFFSEKNFWARDIAFVIPGLDMFGLQAWLNAYSALPPIGDKLGSTVSSGENFIKLESSPLPARCGALQAALVLELGPDANPPRFDLRLEGVNGLLPNLDYVNLVVKVSEKHGVGVTLQNRTDPKRPKTSEGYIHTLKTLLKQMGSLAQFSPSGLHGLFLPLRVEALTMASEPPRPSKRMKDGAADLLAVGRLLEAIIRAVNNLQERFHQSFFFYLLPCTHYFVSIGPYMGAFGAMLASPLLHALALWINARSSNNGEEKVALNKDFPPVSPVWPYLIASLVTGAISYAFIPRLWYTSISVFALTPSQGSIVALSTLLITFIVFLPRSPLFANEKSASFPDWRLAKSVALLFMIVALGALGLLNFSFAFFSGLLLIPTTVFAKPSDRRIIRVFRLAVILLMGSPFTLSLILCLTHPVAPVEVSVLDHLGSLFAKSLTEHYIHGSRFWTAFSLGYIPVWVFLFLIPMLPIEKAAAKAAEKDEGASPENSHSN